MNVSSLHISRYTWKITRLIFLARKWKLVNVQSSRGFFFFFVIVTDKNVWFSCFSFFSSFGENVCVKSQLHDSSLKLLAVKTHYSIMTVYESCADVNGSEICLNVCCSFQISASSPDYRGRTEHCRDSEDLLGRAAGENPP